MAQVGQAGSSGQVAYNAPTEGTDQARALNEVSKGDLEGENIKFSGKEARNEALRGQQRSGPELTPPSSQAPRQMETASAQLGELGELSDQAMANTKTLLNNLVKGSLTQAQKQQLEQNASSLSQASDYIGHLQGRGVDGNQGKRSVLAALGFNASQLEALLSLANPEDDGNSLASMHGGVSVLQEKRAALSSLGLSDQQIDALLSLASADESGSRLTALQQAGKNMTAALEALGFKGDQLVRLQALFNGQAGALGSNEQKALFAKMGFSEAQIEILFSASDPASLKQQESLIRSLAQQPGASQTASYLKGVAIGMNMMAAGHMFNDPIVEQMVDMFAVMELMHQMSASQRRSAREFRAIEYDAARVSILNQAQEMKESALSTAIGGWVSSGTQIVGGIVSGGMALKSPPVNMNPQQQAAWTQTMNTKAQAFSSLAQSGGAAIKSGLDYQAAMHSSEVKIQEAFQKTHDNAAQSETEFMNLHHDMIKTIQSKMDEIIRSWFETLKSTTRG